MKSYIYIIYIQQIYFKERKINEVSTFDNIFLQMLKWKKKRKNKYQREYEIDGLILIQRNLKTNDYAMVQGPRVSEPPTDTLINATLF